MEDSSANASIVNKEFFLQLLDEKEQYRLEEEHLQELLYRLKKYFIYRLKLKITKARTEIESCKQEELTAEIFQKIVQLQGQINENTRKIEEFKSYFTEPYFARMDVQEEQEGYSQYYIGKKGNFVLEIIDWRAPLARKYYQKSQIHFQINQYKYDLILRRAIRIQQGKLIDFKNEYLNVQNYLTTEEIAGRDEKIILDPFLKEILKKRKDCPQLSDIIQTIQEKQYQLISLPERENFIVQGCAGSGKTMVLLHRLSYLLYNNEHLNPKDILVITPSKSFNNFIEELAQVLQLEQVKTITLENYFLKLLKNVNVDIAQKIDRKIIVPQEYLQEIYSEKFYKMLEEQLYKIFKDMKENFIGSETVPYLQKQLQVLGVVLKHYVQIKNANIRIRRAVMGEIREKHEGGFWFTKDFRSIMNAVILVEEFFKIDFTEEKFKRQSIFYNRLLEFYQAGKLIKNKGQQALQDAIKEVKSLFAQLEKEIIDLKRYKVKRGDAFVESYQDRIARRKVLLEECQQILQILQEMEEGLTSFIEIFEILQGNSTLKKIGNATTHSQLARYFYKEFIRPIKDKYRLPRGVLIASDCYIITLILTLLGKELTPKYSLVFVDEGQDISVGEYQLLKAINAYAAFNIYGDLQQNITPVRGLKNWQILDNIAIYELNQNYRNTIQIVDYVQKKLNIQMHPVALNGVEVKHIQLQESTHFLEKYGGSKAIIVHEKVYTKYKHKKYNTMQKTEQISRNKINYLTVYESKGLEFNSVVVIDEGMTEHERYIAYTRALKSLAIVCNNSN